MAQEDLCHRSPTTRKSHPIGRCRSGNTGGNFCHGKERNKRAGGVICDTTTTRPPDKPAMATYVATIGTPDRFNIYFAETTAVARALQNLSTLPSPIKNRVITILSSNLSLLRVISNPIQQSGQSYIRQIYTATHKLAQAGNLVCAKWAPANKHISFLAKAKSITRESPELPTESNDHLPSDKTTVLRLAKQEFQPKPITRVGEYTRKFDTALPGKHTYYLYNAFKRTEADILSQLRTGMSKLTDTYIVFTLLAQSCVRVARLRRQWSIFYSTVLAGTSIGRQCYATHHHEAEPVILLGGKAASDPVLWKPNLPAVQPAVHYAVATDGLRLTHLKHKITHHSLPTF